MAMSLSVITSAIFLIGKQLVKYASEEYQNLRCLCDPFLGDRE
jgi:hypothetical protein